MARKRLKVGAADSSLTKPQQEELVQTIRDALESGAQIPWRKMLESATFATLTYDLLRREGKAVMRQLSRQNGASSGPIKRRVSDVEEAITEPEPLDDRGNEVETLLLAHGDKQKVKELTTLVSEKDELPAEAEKHQKQMESLQQCISELSAIIASKDILLAEANARYEALKEGVRQLAADE